jgi:immunomodulating metalloprotease
MAFYLQIPFLIAQSPSSWSYGGVDLTGGWDIITLLYQAARQLNYWGSNGNTTVWNTKRKLLGMHGFPRVGGAGYPYTSNQDVTSIPGNDLIVITLSWVTGKDWRPYYDLRGIAYSDLASEQIRNHTLKGRIAKTTASDFPFVGLDINLPFSNMSAPLVPIKPNATWPLDGKDFRKCSTVKIG